MKIGEEARISPEQAEIGQRMVAGTETIANGHVPECEIPPGPDVKGPLQDAIKRIGD
jgi:hypothetical protein